MLQFVEGNQSFPPRKTASLNVKNKSSSVFSNRYYHQLKVWVPSFSNWEVGPPEKGELFTFSQNQRLQCWILFALLPAGLRVLLLLWPLLPGSLWVMACAAACSVGAARVAADFLQATVFPSLWTAAHSAVCLLWIMNPGHSSPSLASGKAPAVFQDQPMEKVFPCCRFMVPQGLTEPRSGPIHWIQAWCSSLIFP